MIKCSFNVCKDLILFLHYSCESKATSAKVSRKKLAFLKIGLLWLLCTAPVNQTLWVEFACDKLSCICWSLHVGGALSYFTAQFLPRLDSLQLRHLNHICITQRSWMYLERSYK